MKDFRVLISDYLQSKSKDKHVVELDNWTAKREGHMDTLRRIKLNLFKCQKTANEYQPNTNCAYDKLLQKINAPQKDTTPIISIFRLTTPQSLAASLLILLVSAVTLYLFSLNKTSENWQSISTKNEFKNMKLEDGSQVWLHRNSHIEFPNQFDKDKREILVNGEAFIEVSHESERPFFIRTAANSEIQVMGTALNIRSFEDESEEEIAVASGNVMYRCAANSRPEMKLDKGECAVWHTKSDEIDKMQETDPNIFSWKDHRLVFKNADCKTFEKALERYFNMEVALVDSSLYNARFSAEFKNKNLDQILDYFKARNKIKHEIKKDTCFLWKQLNVND